MVLERAKGTGDALNQEEKSHGDAESLVGTGDEEGYWKDLKEVAATEKSCRVGVGYVAEEAWLTNPGQELEVRSHH